MGFIQTPVRKIMKRKLPNTESLRKAKLDYLLWLKEKGLDQIKPKNKSSEPLVIEPVEDRTGVPMGNKVPVMEKGAGSKKEEMRYTGKRRLIGIAKGFMLGTLSKSQVRTPNNALPSTANLLVPYALSTIAIATNMSLAILLSEAVVQFK